MKVYELIKILANVCRYNPDGEVVFGEGNTSDYDYPVGHLISSIEDDHDERGRQFVRIVPGKFIKGRALP